MCKIFAITNMSKIKGTDKFINLVAKQLAGYERDGFGYTIQGAEGNFGERTTAPKEFKTKFKAKLLEVPFVTHNYNRFGTKAIPIGGGIFHGRTSTNHKTLTNTHPINKHDWSLIHNGVVTNHGPKYEMITTNDTEHLVEHIAMGGVKAIEEHLTGYYAIAAFDPIGQLHILRDDIASLYTCFVDSIESYIFATNPDLIKSVCKGMGWKSSLISPMSTNTYVIFMGNEIVECTEIKPRGDTYAERKYSGLSLGYSRADSEDERYDNYMRDYNGRGERDYLIAQYGTDKPFNTIGSNVIDMTSSQHDRTVADAIAADNEVTDTGFSRDEMEFLIEVNQYADSSYTFRDIHDNNMTVDEFMMLEDEDKLSCTVIRGDGTVCDPNDYFSEKLYEGAM